MTERRPEEQVQKELVDGAVALGYELVDRPTLNEIRAGHMDEPIVVPYLIAAIERLNPDLEHDEAVYAAEKVRRLIDSNAFVDALRFGLNLAIPGKKTVDVRLVDLNVPQNNCCVVTDEFELRTGGMREPRLDTVFLINGLPLKVVENKAPGESLAKGSRDLAGYWEDAPSLAVFTVLAGICNGSKFRVGASGADGLSGYSAWKDTYPHARPAGAGEMETVLLGVCDPATLVDLAAHYVVYETRDGLTRKKLARYQQYRAAEKIVRRIVDGELDRGIVWHTQGSGKRRYCRFRG
jgi:type I restriction enzyme R subunit